MVFSSHTFIYLFLPVFLLVYYAMFFAKTRIGWLNLFITVASYIFYGWFEPWFVSLMWVSTALDYTCGRIISKPGASKRTRNIALAVSMTGNLAMLGFFKYYMFFMGGMNALAAALGLGDHYFRVMQVVLPIGISFYTFQTMSYTIDVWRGDAPPVKDLRTFSCFVSLFPQLVAGPIIRYNTVATQLEHRKHTLRRFGAGIVAFGFGMAMKIWVANPCGQVADAVFAAEAPTMLAAWWGALAYSLQIYFDFNAYSVMALGLGRLIGFEFIRNFNAPYRATGMSDFWKRWHMSLTTWLTDYLYIPLGGNRVSRNRLYFNLFLVMFASGLWHGANLTFVCWGLFHAFFLITERTMGRKPIYHRLPWPLTVLLTNVIVLFAWVLFRAPDLGSAWQYWMSMVGARAPAEAAPLLHSLVFDPFHLTVILAAVALCLQPWQAFDISRVPTPWRLAAALLLLALALAGMATQSYNPFLYFQF